jgi:TonB family protein
MANKPLRSSNPQPQDIQFKHFGVLNSGEQSKTSLFTSITINVLLALVIVIIGAAAKKVVDQRKMDNLAYVVPVKPLPPDPPKPKIPPPPPPKIKIPPPPEVPKIKLPDVKIPDPPKPVEVKVPKPPTPVVTPAPPKVQVAAAAPKVVSVKLPAASASVKNNDAHPTAVALGHPDNPIAVSNRPATAAVNLGNAGQPGMQASNTGRGPVSPVSLGGNGSPKGSIGGGSVRAVEGVKLGVVGGDPRSKGGNGIGTSAPQQVALGHAPTPPAATAVVTKATTRSAPTVIYKPAPTYTEEARAAHIEGTIRVHIHVTAAGQVQVIGIVSGLGHGLDQSALQVCQGMRFKPAIDSNGNPTDWDGNVTVTFQLA